MSEREKADENALRTSKRPKHSCIHIPLIFRLKRGDWHRFKLIEVMTDYELLGYVIHGEEGRDWRWAER